MTIRQLFYRLVSIEAIENSRNDYQRVSSIMTKARNDGRIAFDAIVDRSRSEYMPMCTRTSPSMGALRASPTARIIGKCSNATASVRGLGRERQHHRFHPLPPGPGGRPDGGRCDGGREGAEGGRDAGGRDGRRDGGRRGGGPQLDHCDCREYHGRPR